MTDGIRSALERAQAAAGGLDVRISGGADAIRQYLDAGLVDEVSLRLAPILMGKGVRLFDNFPANRLKLVPVGASASPGVTHLSYRVAKG